MLPPAETNALNPSRTGGRRSVGLIVGIVVLVVAVATIIGLAILKPWAESDDAAVQDSFQLNNGRTMTLAVPAGWAARPYKTKDSIRGVLFERAGDTRLADDVESLTRGGSVSSAHVIILESGAPCTGDSWKMQPVQTTDEGGVQVKGRRAALLSGGTTCLYAKAGDRETDGGVSATDILPSLTKTVVVAAGK